MSWEHPIHRFLLLPLAVTTMGKTTVLLALTLLTVSSAGCEPRSTDAGIEAVDPVVCTVVVDTPKKMDDAERMAGAVRFRCENPGAEVLTLKARVEKKDGEQWHTALSRTFTLRGRDTYAPGLKYQARALELSCGTGTYRTVVDWSRVSRSNTKGDNLVSGSMREPCKPFFRFPKMS
jgi:hypothetical protein